MKKLFLLLLFVFSVLSFSFAQGNEEIIVSAVTEDQTVITNFTPSAESKLVPELQPVVKEVVPELNIVQYEDFPTEEGYIGVDEIEEAIQKQDEDPIILVTDDRVVHKGEEADIIGAVLKKYVEIIPYANKDQLTPEQGQDIVIAYEQLADAQDFTEVVEDLEDFVDNDGDDLAATQIFYIRPRNDIEEYIYDHETFNLRITFQLHLRSDQEPPTVIVKIANTNIWYTVDPKSMIRDWLGDGNLTIDFHHFGTVVFLEPRK